MKFEVGRVEGKRSAGARLNVLVISGAMYDMMREV